jgi:phage pi2 protein 07
MNTEGNAETRLAPHFYVSHTAIIWPSEVFIDNREKINSHNLKVLNLHKIFGPPYKKRIEIRTGGIVLYV